MSIEMRYRPQMRNHRVVFVKIYLIYAEDHVLHTYILWSLLFLPVLSEDAEDNQSMRDRNKVSVFAHA